MSSVAAIFENGVFRPLVQVDLPEATRVEIPLPERVPNESSRGDAAAWREDREKWMRELDQIRERGRTGVTGTPLQQIFDDLRG